VVRYFVTSCPADDFDGCVSIPPRAGRPAALLYHKWAESAFHFIHFFISLSEESIAPVQSGFIDRLGEAIAPDKVPSLPTAR